MKVMVIGSGGREHAIITKLRENENVTELYALPGNGGIAKLAVCVPVKATDLDGTVAFASEHSIDFAVVTPDDPLALGMVDKLEEIGVRCFGPNKAAARIEGSKLFAKEFMQKYGIPTAEYRRFDDEEEAFAYLDTAAYPAVIKADGLALGKGVYIAKDHEEARTAVRELMCERKFGQSGARILIEEYLEGAEASVLCFTDGECIKPMVSAMDHKRAGEDDTGPNTGGMGAIAPNPYYRDDIACRCMEEIFAPTVAAMKNEGCPFQGCLYFGLMLTKDGPKVIEYNCRFGDPETQAVLPLLKSDLLEIMLAVREKRLADVEVSFLDKYSCCVVMVSGGYPSEYKTGMPISIGDIDALIFHSGTKQTDVGYITSGGRVLGVTAVGDTANIAVQRSYAAVEKISFKDAYYRRDIGKR